MFPAKVSVRFQEREKKARKNDGFNWYDRCFSGIHYPCALLSREVDLALPDGHGWEAARARQVADASRQTTNHMRINSLLA